MTEAELAAIDARLVKAAPRTWGHSMACRYPEGCTCDASEHNAAVAYANAARDDLRRLRAEVDRLRALVALPVESLGERIDHCSGCGGEFPPQKDDVCPVCQPGPGLISTWGEAQAERYRTGERYDPDSAAGCADLEGVPYWRAALEAAGLVRNKDGDWRRAGYGGPYLIWSSMAGWWATVGGADKVHPTEEAAARAWLARQEARRG